jgi:hypothetical protein
MSARREKRPARVAVKEALPGRAVVAPAASSAMNVAARSSTDASPFGEFKD